MPDTHSPEQRHRNMAAIRSVSTKPELELRHSLWALGFRYTINDKKLPGKPDMVLPKYRTVIFIHGCFWHGHKNCKHFTIPKTNSSFWIEKVAKNQIRDQRVWRDLEAAGWNVIIVWECELSKNRIENTVIRVVSELSEARKRYYILQRDRKVEHLRSYEEHIDRKRAQQSAMHEYKEHKA